MEDNWIGIVLIVLGFVAVIGNMNQKPRFVHMWFVVLTAVFTGYYSFQNLRGFEDSEPDMNPFYLGISILFLALVISKFIGTGKKAYIGLVGVLFPLLFLILGDKTYAFGGNGFTGMDLVKAGVLGSIVPLAFLIVFSLFKRVGTNPDKAGEEVQLIIESGFMFLFLAGASIAGFFLAGPFGLFAVLVSYLSSSILADNAVEYGRKTIVPFALTFILLLPLTHLVEVGDADNLSILQGKVLAGLFFGAMAVAFHSGCIVWSEKIAGWKSKVLLAKAIVIPVLFVHVGGLLYFMYESFGGTSLVVSMLIGAALVIPLVHIAFPNTSFGVTALLVGSALFVTPHLKHESTDLSTEIKGVDDSTQRITVVQDDGSQKELDILDLNEAKGEWVVNMENSALNFSLDASGSNTKGKFKTYEGTFIIADNWENARMKITIPVKSISTFNEIRDESLLSDEEFFEESKFPVITYDSKSLELTEKGYIAEGDFKMKGITKKVPFTFQFVGKGERDGKAFIVLKGTGSLNRTDFGMTPDPGIGDVVNFEFQTEFVAK